MTEYPQVALVSQPTKSQIIVDMRHPQEAKERPLKVANQVLCIPFYRIQDFKSQYDPNQQYLLYCEQGRMSRLQAILFREEGIDNVDVYLKTPEAGHL